VDPPWLQTESGESELSIRIPDGAGQQFSFVPDASSDHRNPYRRCRTADTEATEEAGMSLTKQSAVSSARELSAQAGQPSACHVVF
jgi:hypothetical protein